MSNLEELEVKNVCSLSCDAPTNMCSLLGDHTCGDGGETIQERGLEKNNLQECNEMNCEE